MCSVRRITSTETIVCSLALAGLLLFAGCNKQPESAPKETQASPPPPPVQAAQYKEVDCTCDDTLEKNVDLDDFLKGANDAKKAGTLDKFVADHMAGPPQCIRIKDNENQKQKIHWKAKQSKGRKFQITKIVNFQDGQDADLFDNKPPFP